MIGQSDLVYKEFDSAAYQIADIKLLIDRSRFAEGRFRSQL